MAIKYSMPVDAMPDLKQKKVAFIADPTTSDANLTSALKSVIDCLISYHMVATA